MKKNGDHRRSYSTIRPVHVAPAEESQNLIPKPLTTRMPRCLTQSIRASGTASSPILVTSNPQTFDNSMFLYPLGFDLTANASVETITIIAPDVRTLTGGKLVGHDQNSQTSPLPHHRMYLFRSPDRKRQRSKLNMGCIGSVGISLLFLCGRAFGSWR